MKDRPYSDEIVLKPVFQMHEGKGSIDCDGLGKTNLAFTDSKQNVNNPEYLKMPYSLLAKGDVPNTTIIEEGTDDQVEAHGYCESLWRKCLYNFGGVISCGVLLLVTKWFPVWKVWMRYRPCSVSSATVLLLKDSHGSISIVEVVVRPVSESIPPELVYSRSVSSISSHSHGSMNFNYSSAISYRHFIHNCVKYVWDSSLSSFKRLRGYESFPCSLFFKFEGLLAIEQEEKRELYEPNKIDVVVKSYADLFFSEVMNPFYIFQVFSMILWAFDDYVLYATCILVITIVSICFALYETRQQQITLRDMVSRSNSVMVTVMRQKDVFEEIPAADLVPGDVISIPPRGCHMACDAVLLTGNCIVNESMLTGESVPETKTPVTKDKKNGQDELYCPTAHKRNTLFCGTEVIQTRYYTDSKVLAVVVRTGFSTAKGELVRSILFPKPLGFKFYRDSLRFVMVLFLIAAIGMSYSIYCYIMRDSPILQTIVRALDIITIVVPPALPAAMTIGIVYAQSRLKKQKIFCISPPRINIGGKLKLICFDKTGTLTEDGLDFWGLIPTAEGKFKELEQDASVLSNRNPLKIAMASCHSLTIIDKVLRGDPMDLKMFQATSWELEEPGSDATKFDQLNPTVIRPRSEKSKLNCNGLDSGDIALVQDTNCDEKVISFPLSPTKDSSFIDEIPYEVGILRQLPFASSLQRMSVICRTLGSRHMDLYSKGAPEKIYSLCLPDTLPDNFHEVLKDYTLQGYRVLALAYRKLDSKLPWHHAVKIDRDELEKDLTFLGLLIMQNTLKPETTPVIKSLKDAHIRCVMVTGDNVMTAMSVARDCHMIPESDRIIVVSGKPRNLEKPAQLTFEYAETPTMKTSSSILSESLTSTHGDSSPVLARYVDMAIQQFHFVMDGEAFGVIRKYFPELMNKILLRGSVYARMAPDQKTQLVEALQNIDYVVGMCGDGANDCGALKAADVGISLSDTEASVAAPFTSNIPNIECVPIVIREGRCALVTSFATFRFIALYSMTQFISVLILYTVDTNLTDQMFLYIDLGVITFLAISMGYTKAFERLVAQRPRCSLVSVPNIVSLLFQVLFVGMVQVGAIIFLQYQKWYKPVHSEDEIFPCWENTVVFLVSSFQYVITALIVSDGPPYRKHFFTNYFYLTILALTLGFNILLLFNPFEVLAKIMAIVKWQPNHFFMFRVTLLLGVLCNLFLALAFEMLVVNSRWLRWLVRKIKNKTEAKNEYKRIDKDVRENYDWPPISSPICEPGPILISQ